MNWTVKQHGNITLKHFSSSSLILLTVTDEDGTEDVWFTYKEFEELKEMMKDIDVE